MLKLIKVGLVAVVMVMGVGTPWAGPHEDFDDGLKAQISNNSVEAMRLFLRAAKLGHALAQYNTGYGYQTGQGIDQNFQEAIKWYRLAAENGVPEAQYNLCRLYEKGMGVKKSYSHAHFRCLQAAKNNFAPAQAQTGYQYALGRYVQKDYVTALMWFIIAANKGDAFGDRGLKNIVRIMNESKIQEAQRRARICVNSNYRNCD